MHKKPELLLPAGNTESFFAALEAGADAVYLGLMQFNARGRARNFTNSQFLSVLNEARKRNVRVYVTLNTVVKNPETETLVEYLHFLEKSGVDGIIVQDWGVYFLARNVFPGLNIHASTQLGIHNSLGTHYLATKGFKRVVLARELTLKELSAIAETTTIEAEVFVHGALCYSFSGMCLFSSYIGGRGANRGLCAQPCRRDYSVENKTKFLFNLKDNQLLDFVPQLTEIGINSFKIEGRMKPGEYTHRVGAAYRAVIDDPKKIEEARKSLELDFGRPKTAYFIGNDVKTAISDETSTGIFLGKVERIAGNRVLISSSVEIETKFRLRILSELQNEPVYIVVQQPTKEGNGYWVERQNQQIELGSRVYLTKMQDRKFPDRIELGDQRTIAPISEERKNSILNSLKGISKNTSTELYFRIDSMEWFPRINFDQLDGLFLNLTQADWKLFKAADSFIQDNRNKVYIELPKFIAEKSIAFYAELINKLVSHGIRNFILSHISQKLLIPAGCRIITSENVYIFNDAAATFLENEGVEQFVYPQEIDFETLESLTHKNGIVPVYFFPELFYSRMPVELDNGDAFSGEEGKTKFKRFRKNGVTIIVPDRPVSILQHKAKLEKAGFSRFLIDVSYETVSKNRLKTLKTRFLKSEQIQPSTSFNFIKGLK